MADTPPILFSVCTITNKPEEYIQMRDSFIARGFDETCEWLQVDNSRTQHMDAYQAIPWFIDNAKGRYILIVHQDVLCVDTKDRLLDIVSRLDESDPRWSVAGNAGCDGYKSCYFHLINNGRERKSKSLPRKVSSLDENFLLINSRNKPSLSTRLSGFHLYGTDICLRAIEAGFTCYVIPFLVNHLSLGNLAALDAYLPVFLEEYDAPGKGKFVQTTCTKFYLGKTKEETRRMNKPRMFELVKAWQRIRNIFYRPGTP